MPKLQLYIAKSLRGYKSLVNFNPEEDVRRHVGDFRAALEGVEYDTAKVNIFHLLCYRSQGVMITVIRTIPDGSCDHLAASLFVPDGLGIESGQLLDIIAEITRRVSAPAMDSNDIADLRSLFSTDYPSAPVSAAKVDSEGRTYAYAHTGGTNPTFEDYAATGFYIPAFGEYSGVLLVPAAIECGGTDATPAAIPQLIALNPPQETGNGFVPHIYGHVFNIPYLVPKDKPVEIVWRRGGFDNVVQTVTATDSESARQAPPTSGAVKSITPGSFYITAQRSQQPLENATVKVNGCEIKGPVNFTFEELEHAQVEITAPGFFTFSGKLDLATTTQALVQMKELRKIYRFDLPVVTPEPEESIHFTIQSKKELSQCPVEGYAVTGEGLQEGISRTNNLIYVGGRSRRSLKYLIAVGVAGIAVGFMAGWLSFGFHNNEDVEQEAIEIVAEEREIMAEENAVPVIPPQPAEETPAPTAPAVEEPAAATPQPQAHPAAEPDYAAAVQYLDSNRSWTAERLAELGIPEFFDDLNTYNFERIKNYWSPRLETSNNFKILLRAVEGAASKPDPRRDNHNPTYNRPGDNTIGWRGYTYWIDP